MKTITAAILAVLLCSTVLPVQADEAQQMKVGDALYFGQYFGGGSYLFNDQYGQEETYSEPLSQYDGFKVWEYYDKMQKIFNIDGRYIRYEYMRSMMPIEFLQPLKWRVISIENGVALLFSSDVVMRDYFPLIKDTAEWSKRAVRNYLNGTKNTYYETCNFYDIAFSDLEKSAVVPHPTIGDKVFLLSREEAKKYSTIIGKPTGNDSWLLRNANKEDFLNLSPEGIQTGTIEQWYPCSIKLSMYVDLSKLDLQQQGGVYYEKKAPQTGAMYNFLLSAFSGNWADSDIKAAKEIGLLTIPNNVFQTIHTYNNITREQFCELAVRTYLLCIGENEPTSDLQINTFEDTGSRAVAYAYQLGIISGKSSTIFDPTANITRQEAATMLHNMAKTLHITENTEPLAFADSDMIASFAKDSVYTVTAIEDTSGARLMQGVGKAQFDPMGNYTVEQAISTLMRLYRVYQK